MLTTNIIDTSTTNAVKAKVELYTGSTLDTVCNCEDVLQSITIDRTGDTSKFFGFGVGHKINIKLIDLIQEIDVSTSNTIKIAFGDGTVFDYPFPSFYVTEVHKDEDKNIISVTAYDAISKPSTTIFGDLGLIPSYTIRSIAEACATALGSSIKLINVPDEIFDTEYPEGANFGGTETLRAILDDIAEATQTIYYINNADELVFKRLDKDGAAVLTIEKADYYTLDTKTNRRLTGVCSATELGDNVEATLEQSGTTQYVRDNAFWELREDIGVLVENALDVVGGLTINQFTLDWDGNYLLEIGDKFDIVAEDNSIVTSYLISETVTYDGAIGAKTDWEYTNDEAETANNPSSLGDALNRTFARVDKVNKEIEIVSGETATIKLTTDSIQSTVSELDNNIAEVISEVNTKVTSEDVEIAVQKAMGEGVDSVRTSTGFTFNESGLHISKSTSNITTTIDEDGMTVNRENTAVLIADNLGVRAEDLHATTFLIVGNNSRFEDYNSNRTGCFYIGRV